MAKKANKAAQILELLNAGISSATIAKRLKASPSYIWKLKKEMAHKAKAEEPKDEVAKQPSAEDIKETLYRITRGRQARQAEATNVDKILDKRAEQYGSFMASANVAIRLKGVMHNAIAQQDLHLAPDQLLALDMIAVKVSRILTGNPSHLDSWLDIAGYAKLVADRLQGNAR